MPAADIIFANANIITMDKKRPAAQMVSVNGGKIVFVGANSEIDNFREPERVLLIAVARRWSRASMMLIAISFRSSGNCSVSTLVCLK